MPLHEYIKSQIWKIYFVQRLSRYFGYNVDPYPHIRAVINKIWKFIAELFRIHDDIFDAKFETFLTNIKRSSLKEF